MILDTSALAAIFFGEPEADHFTQVIHDADRCLISAASFLELSIVVEGQIGSGALIHCDMFSAEPALSLTLSRLSRRISRARPSTTLARAVTRPG
ncbi:MAG TPA: type II toxin-antitoxin system VapC family toxin [Terriglobia bacterium]